MVKEDFSKERCRRILIKNNKYVINFAEENR